MNQDGIARSQDQAASGHIDDQRHIENCSQVAHYAGAKVSMSLRHELGAKSE